MNNYIEEVRKRSQNLLIVEGKHEKDELFKLLFRCFPEMKISMHDIWIYGTNIYMLYEDIVKEYGEQWEKDDIDLPFVISKKQGRVPLRYKEDFTNTGKLYINYPMIESYQHLCSLPDRDYFDRKIPVSLRPRRKYKSLVREESVIEKFIEFPKRIDELLKEHFKIADDEKRRECCEKIFALKSEENLHEQIHTILSGIIKAEYADTAKYQLAYMIKRVKYAKSGQTYWRCMRNIFKQIILHNVFKAVKLQYNIEITDKEKYRDNFERIDPNIILNIQNTVSKNNESGFIWILCMCVFLVPEYNRTLVA